MAYSNTKTKKSAGLIYRLKSKIGKLLAKSFPLNGVRVMGLRMCGFSAGKKVYIGEDLIIASMISEKSCNLKIGDRVAIGPRVTILLSSDANWSHLMQDKDPIRGTVILEDDCWLGAGVIIMPNVTIGKKAIIGAGAVVTKDVPANTVFAGVPAKKIQKNA